MTTIVTISGGPFPSDATLVYTGQLLDGDGVGIPASALATLTLSIADTMTGTIVNNCSQVDILNTGRGTIDNLGNLVVTLTPADTSLVDWETCVSPVQRSLVIDWATGSGIVGRHQVNFALLQLIAA